MTKKKPAIKEPQSCTLHIISGLSAWKFLAELLIQHFAHRLTQKDKDE